MTTGCALHCRLTPVLVEGEVVTQSTCDVSAMRQSAAVMPICEIRGSSCCSTTAMTSRFISTHLSSASLSLTSTALSSWSAPPGRSNNSVLLSAVCCRLVACVRTRSAATFTTLSLWWLVLVCMSRITHNLSTGVDEILRVNS